MEEFDSRKYYLTAELLLLKVIKNLYPNLKMLTRCAVNNGIYMMDEEKNGFSKEEIEIIKIALNDIINRKVPIKKSFSSSEMIDDKTLQVLGQGFKNLLETVGDVFFYIYEIENYKTYFLEELYDNSSYINEFDIYPYKQGLMFRTLKIIDGDLKIPPRNNTVKLMDEYEKIYKWNKKNDVFYINQINNISLSGNIKKFIKKNECLHNHKIMMIAKQIQNNRDIKIITIAGPSSSGKTTFSNKLKVGLEILGFNPILISLDNYYIGRDKVPVDSDGNKDFESLNALDIETLNNNLNDLIAGKEVEIPKYDFKKGEREEVGEKVILKNDVIIIEGIHGLNENLLKNITKDSIFKIYISCLVQMNMGNHYRIKTSIVRKMRRLVRDSISRNISVKGTFEMWDRVRKGENKNIFPYEDNADVIFNSNLVYEIGVLKPFLEKELIKVKRDSPYYKEARSVIKLLSYFINIPEKYVPDDSILKEFIGGSYFYKY